MKKVMTLAGLSLFALIGAAYPDAPQLHYGAAVIAGTSEVSGPTYRPCRRDRRDDRCIQLYERGVRVAYADWLRGHGMGGPDADMASARRHARPARQDRAHHERARHERVRHERVRHDTHAQHRRPERHADASSRCVDTHEPHDMGVRGM